VLDFILHALDLLVLVNFCIRFYFFFLKSYFSPLNLVIRNFFLLAKYSFFNLNFFPVFYFYFASCIKFLLLRLLGIFDFFLYLVFYFFIFLGELAFKVIKLFFTVFIFFNKNLALSPFFIFYIFSSNLYKNINMFFNLYVSIAMRVLIFLAIYIHQLSLSIFDFFLFLNTYVRVGLYRKNLLYLKFYKKFYFFLKIKTYPF